jgi:CRISPR/Cas system Type II protein with McrA/HNH and RuvC-like nuclease domain
VTFTALLMTPLWRAKRREYGKQQKNSAEQHPNRHPPATEAVLNTEPQCSYQDGDLGSNSQDHMISCLLAGMDENSHKQVDYDKTNEVTQDPYENPPLFLNHLTEAIIKYTNLNPTSQESRIFLHLHFISQSTPDI